MTQDIKELEQKLKNKQNYKKSIIQILGEIFPLGMREIQKTIENMLGAPKTGENQINKELEDFENKIILDKKN